MNKQPGFTLLELLIAMTLMGIILVMLYGGLRLGMRSWEVGEARADSINELRVVQDFIRRQLRQAVTTTRMTDDNQGRAIAFEGEPERVVFVAPMLEYLGLGGLYVIQIDAIEDAESAHLRVRWWPFRPDAFEQGEDSGVEGGGVEETVLLSGVSELQWSYFGASEPNADPQWYEHWENTSQPPMLVRLRLLYLGESWPDLVMAMPDEL